MTAAVVRVRRAERPVDATVELPGSKSITNRALVCAALASGASELLGALDADDTAAMVGCLRGLGADIAWIDGALVVRRGADGSGTGPLDARQSGTTGRFVLPAAAIWDTPRRIDGDPQLRARPMAPTFDALRSMGARVAHHGEPEHLPATVTGPARGGTVTVESSGSSQFLSGLLLSGPRFAAGLQAVLDDELVSEPYVAMTVAVMESFGCAVLREPGRFTAEPTGYRGRRYRIEPDASAAAYAWAAAAMTGGTVTVPGLHRGSLQGDTAFAELLGRMGAAVSFDHDSITVSGTGGLRGIDVDMREISDTVPTLAVVAAIAETPTEISGVGFIRHKESDRIGGVVAELRRCGIDAYERPEGLVVQPGTVRPAVVETYRDHRMAMAFALLGLVCDGIEIADPACVAKTLPGFWDVLEALSSNTLPPAHPISP